MKIRINPNIIAATILGASIIIASIIIYNVPQPGRYIYKSDNVDDTGHSSSTLFDTSTGTLISRSFRGSLNDGVPRIISDLWFKQTLDDCEKHVKDTLKQLERLGEARSKNTRSSDK